MIDHPFALVAVLAYVAAILRLLAYRKQGARHRHCVSLLAWLFVVVLGGSAIELAFKPHLATLFDAGRAALLALFVFGVRGNVAGLLRSE